MQSERFRALEVSQTQNTFQTRVSPLQTRKAWRGEGNCWYCDWHRRANFRVFGSFQQTESSEVLSRTTMDGGSGENQEVRHQNWTLDLRQKRSGEHIRGSKSCKCKVDPRPERLTPPRHGHVAPKLQSNLKLRINTNSAWSGGKCPCNCISLRMCMSPQKRWQRSLIPRWVQLVTLVQWLDSRCEGFVGIMQVSSLSNSNRTASRS